VNQRPASAELTWEECGVLVFGRHDRAVAFESLEVFSHRQRNEWSGARVGGVGHGVTAEAIEKDDARIFNTPEFFRVLIGGCGKRWLSIDAPIGDTVSAARGREMRDTPTVLHAHQQQRVVGGQSDRARVEDRVRRVRPVRRLQKRIAWVALKEILEFSVQDVASLLLASGRPPGHQAAGHPANVQV
jgi:hypothetical protein